MGPRELAAIALDGARLAREVHRRHLGQVAPTDWAEKGASDYVTSVDRKAEQVVVEHVRRCCPGHEILAEESTELSDPAAVLALLDRTEHLWLVDPLDGTTNYLHGYPAFAASVAVAVAGRVVAGAVVDSASGDEWWAWHGGGAWRNGERIRVSSIEEPGRALIGTGFPFKVPDRLPEYLAQFEAVLLATSDIRRGGSAAIDLCHVADGRFEGFWELWLAPWDVAAGTLIAREAGGVVTSAEGAQDVRAGGSIVAGNTTIHEELLGLMKEASKRAGQRNRKANPQARRV